MDHELLSLLPLDILIGVFSFSGGAFAMWRRYRKSPLHNATLFLQVSILIFKMAQTYFNAHPHAKEKLNARIVELMERISNQLREYGRAHGLSEPDGPLG